MFEVRLLSDNRDFLEARDIGRDDVMTSSAISLFRFSSDVQYSAYTSALSSGTFPLFASGSEVYSFCGLPLAKPFLPFFVSGVSTSGSFWQSLHKPF